MTPAGVARLKLDEACRLQAYWDAEGKVWTVGYGCTGSGIGPHTRWTQVQADAALMQRIRQIESALHQAWPWFAQVEGSWPVRADVLENIAFNVGVRGLEEWHVTLAAVEQHRWSDAGADIRRNAKWRGQVHGRDDRCAAAMTTGHWA